MVIKNAVTAKTLQQKAFGLLLAPKGTAMIFQTRFGIHTFFMKYPIDVLVLDKENKVVSMKHNLQPNRIFVWKPIYDTLIELPEGSLQNASCKLGDKIEII